MQPFFRPYTGYSVPFPVTTISTNVCLSSFGSTDNRGWSAVQCYNQSTVDVYLNFTASSGTTQSSFSTGPFPSANCGVPVPLHQIVVYPIPPVCWVSGLTTVAAVPALVLLTPGTLNVG